ncbi:hypothetical protein [Chitinophaga polysaccharea]|uniref:hypothetical protein n=1 Tax=Chitinophaga polysaccharea TaxID=1293035 RepID=UPI00115A080D|nr:hypothetical protein [Chitinophaga polysaccharea]
MNNPLFRKLISLLTLTSTLYLACKKEGVNSGNKQSLNIGNVISVADARKWYENSSEIIRDSSKKEYIGMPDWEHTFQIPNTDVGGILKVPLENFRTPYGYRDLLFQQNKDGAINVKVLQIIAYPTYLQKKMGENPTIAGNIRLLISNNDFSGLLLQYDTKGNFIEGRKYRDGGVKKILSPLTAGNRNLRTESSCDDEEGPDKNLCWIINLPTVTITAPALGTTPSPSSWAFPEISPIPGPGMPIGGGPPIDVSKYFGNQIKSEVKNPCLTEGINKALAINLKNWLSKAISDIFGDKANFDLIFREKPGSEMAGKSGEYDIKDSHFAGLGTKNAGGVAYINLNSDLLPYASKEYIVTTVLHESLHAYMVTKQISFNAAYVNQHELIASKYSGYISAALKEIFPSISSTDQNDLSWTGLQETLQWTSKDLKDRSANADKYYPGDQNATAKTLINIYNHQSGTAGTKSGCK